MKLFRVERKTTNIPGVESQVYRAIDLKRYVVNVVVFGKQFTLKDRFEVQPQSLAAYNELRKDLIAYERRYNEIKSGKRKSPECLSREERRVWMYKDIQKSITNNPNNFPSSRGPLSYGIRIEGGKAIATGLPEYLTKQEIDEFVGDSLGKSEGWI